MDSAGLWTRFLPYKVFPSWLGAETASALLSYAIANEALFQPTAIGDPGHERFDPDYRRSVSISRLGPFAKPLRAAARQALEHLGPDFGMNPEAVRQIELQLAAHNHGAFYKIHSDVLSYNPDRDKGCRQVTMVYYLYRRPRGFTGGALRFYSVDRKTASFDIEPPHGDMIAFPAFAPHSVELVTCPSRDFADSRFAINLWLRG